MPTPGLGAGSGSVNERSTGGASWASGQQAGAVSFPSTCFQLPWIPRGTCGARASSRPACHPAALPRTCFIRPTAADAYGVCSAGVQEGAQREQGARGSGRSPARVPLSMRDLFLLLPGGLPADGLWLAAWLKESLSPKAAPPPWGSPPPTGARWPPAPNAGQLRRASPVLALPVGPALAL